MYEQQSIQCDRDGCVQWMKTDTAAVGIVDGISQQVIHIDGKAAQKQAKSLQPFFEPENEGSGQRYQEM